MIYGILPMAGKGSRIQPIGFSKELYPIVYKGKHFAISEYTITSMLTAGVDEIKLVVNPDKMDIAKYYSQFTNNLISIYFYESPSLPESCLYPIQSLNDDDICLFGLPDTLFSPKNSYLKIKQELVKGADICLGLFQVEDGSKYDSVKLDRNGIVREIVVKQNPPLSNWIWGIWGANVKTLKILKNTIMNQHGPGEKLLGRGMNELAKISGITFKGVQLSNQYFDIGSMESIIKANDVVEKFTL